MTYDARQITNWFIQRASADGKTLSIMSLLKLTYISHGWRLEMQGEPLFPNRVEAWQHGPVIPDVYSTFRPQGISPFKMVDDFPPPSDKKDTEFLDQIYKIYGGLSPFKLSELTHVPNGPWEISRKLGGWYAEIPNELIKSHYDNKRQTSQRANV